nr:unnamed protein product [Callosobruchus chinensis]
MFDQAWLSSIECHQRNCLPIFTGVADFAGKQLQLLINLARVDSSSPLCWSKPRKRGRVGSHTFVKQHTHKPQRNTTHRHQPRNSDLFKFFRGRTPGLIGLGGSYE